MKIKMDNVIPTDFLKNLKNTKKRKIPNFRRKLIQLEKSIKT